MTQCVFTPKQKIIVFLAVLVVLALLNFMSFIFFTEIIGFAPPWVLVVLLPVDVAVLLVAASKLRNCS